MTTLSDIYQKQSSFLKKTPIPILKSIQNFISAAISAIPSSSLKLSFVLEDEYDLEFDNQDLQLEKYKSIDDFIQMVYQKIVQLSGEGDGS